MTAHTPLHAFNDETTVVEAFQRVVEVWHERPFIAVPARAERDYHPSGIEISYGDAARMVDELVARYRESGVGHGHRIALLLENRPEHLLHKLALNLLGASSVPVNPEYRTAEIAYLVNHSAVDGAVCVDKRREQFDRGVAAAGAELEVVMLDDFVSGAPRPRKAAPLSGPVSGATEASIQYTSGTTGSPKGCIMSQNYELAAGVWYAQRGGLAEVQPHDRLYTALPLYHCNALIYSFYRMMMTGGCQIQSDRFSPVRWWDEIRQTRANIFHYLGVLIPMLMEMPPSDDDRRHQVRFAVGAGVEPELHRPFEERFGIPLIEQWGMTEAVRCLGDYHPPRKVGTRACGRGVPGMEVRVIDDAGQDVPDGTSGELVVRHSERTPRKSFFSGYLKDETATEKAWQGGWFHSGDVVTRDPDGMLHFVERKKNIIRRSGENIAPAEIENLLITHPQVSQVAVMSVSDEVREQEVLACIALRDATADRTTAEAIVAFCLQNLAYYKAPGWIYFLDEIPTTGTLKVQKHRIFAAGIDPRTLAGMIDTRALKKRGAIA